MKTLGDSMGKFLSLLIFKIILVLYIIFIATKLVVVILVENISGVSARREQVADDLSWSLTGKSIMDHAQNSKTILKSGEKNPSVE